MAGRGRIFVSNHDFSLKRQEYLELSTETGNQDLSGYSMIVFRSTHERKEVTIEVLDYPHSVIKSYMYSLPSCTGLFIASLRSFK